MNKHAYLIICHNNPEILTRLVQLLDDPRNDIYIHVDRQSGPIADWKRRICASSATVTFTKRVNVNWGGFSQIEAELTLLKAAIKNNYSYYHLLSGVDLPLKQQDTIHAFFEEHQGDEFISIDVADANDPLFAQRLQYYRFFQDRIGRRRGYHIAALEYLERFSLFLQRAMNVNRMAQHRIPLYKGGNWFSITHQMADYILNNINYIRKHFNHTICSDELFLQTLAMSSPYAKNIVTDTMRYIDWNRGSPYTFRSEDFDLLMNSGRLFARKFDANTDMEIVERIYAALTNLDGDSNDLS